MQIGKFGTQKKEYANTVLQIGHTSITVNAMLHALLTDHIPGTIDAMPLVQLSSHTIITTDAMQLVHLIILTSTTISVMMFALDSVHSHPIINVSRLAQQQNRITGRMFVTEFALMEPTGKDLLDSASSVPVLKSGMKKLNLATLRELNVHQIKNTIKL